MSNDIIHCQNTQYMNEGGAETVITKVLSLVTCMVVHHQLTLLYPGGVIMTPP